MGKRLRLAEGLASGSLSAEEEAEALANRIIVKEAERLRKPVPTPKKRRK